MEGKCTIESSKIRPDKPSNCTFAVDAKLSTSPHVHRHVRGVSKIYSNVLDYIGLTPLIQINKLRKKYNIECEVLAKCEFYNPGGSVKDRIAARMIEDAETSGRIKPGDTLIEPTSGNTGIGIAMAAAAKGYRCIIVMPEKMSMEKVDVLRALGAEIVRTPTAAPFDSPESNIGVAERLQKEIPGSHILNQYMNPSNPLAHYDNTAQEIIDSCDGKLDMVVVGAGTGGTIAGIGRKIRQLVPSCKVVGVDPYGSILAQPSEINKTDVTYYDVEGIGYDFIPTVLDRSVVDNWIKTDDRHSFNMSRELIREEGLLCGGSSGAIMWAAFKAIKDFKMGKGKRVVVLLPDSVRNYMTKFLSEDWMYQRGFMSHPNLILDRQRSKSISGDSAETWADLPVSRLNLQAPLTVLPTLSIQSTLDLLTKDGFDQVPVVQSNGEIVGMVTVSRMMTTLIKGQVQRTDPVSCASYGKFNKVSLDIPLSQVSRLLDIDHYVLVTHKQRLILDSGKEEVKEMIYGIVTKIDLVNFLMANANV